MNEKKTWSRELSVAMLLLVGYLAVQDQVEALEVVIWPVMAFSIAAFGLKQEAIQEKLKGGKG